ncbi:uncharacterized protein HMPREF1541_10670 [Cyphellophora europaea CBS 101466]|uniref:Cytochrome b561 domain-containing protein n=1 Tax=Cyphellophora europaea (strain CBS 101466) TaxID=1220924 RepID=W2S672_CYPE1|nr:uncharacterized protein HMPREF1541_10670 [Cyphellophora europaea CBS 101466]ETN44120.1 hypothetical protein HMPREF1541_10670 [Cyphellophora europaea CBS 101466]
MASATGIPEQVPASSEQEPLLGRPGDATQQSDQGLYYNFFTGTAILAQVGVWILAAIIWAAIFEHGVMFFSAHPLLQSAGVLFLVQAILIVQPTATQKQKRDGTWAHSALNFVGVGALVAGVVVIELNKAPHPDQRFKSPHGILGMITFGLICIQAIVGFVQYWTPSLLGGVDNGKALYKYHRVSGYTVLFAALATVATATQTDFNKNVLGVRLWAVLVAIVLVLIGIIPRVKPAKLGF